MTKHIARVWAFVSDSSSREYETLQYSDGSTSCNCMGWTRRVSHDGTRSCKHTRLVDMGRADAMCQSSHDYETPDGGSSRRSLATASEGGLIQFPLFQLPKLGQRKLVA